MKLSVLKLNSNKLTAMCSEFQKFLLGIETFNIEDNPWIDVELHPLSGLAESEQKKFLMKWKREEELKSSENDFVLIRKSTELTKAEADCESEPDRLPINLPGTHHGDSMEEELLELPNRTGGPLKQFIRARPPPRKPLPIPEESPAYASRGLDNPVSKVQLGSNESSISKSKPQIKSVPTNSPPRKLTSQDKDTKEQLRPIDDELKLSIGAKLAKPSNVTIPQEVEDPEQQKNSNEPTFDKSKKKLSSKPTQGCNESEADSNKCPNTPARPSKKMVSGSNVSPDGNNENSSLRVPSPKSESMNVLSSDGLPNIGCSAPNVEAVEIELPPPIPPSSTKPVQDRTFKEIEPMRMLSGQSSARASSSVRKNSEESSASPPTNFSPAKVDFSEKTELNRKTEEEFNQAVNFQSGPIKEINEPKILARHKQESSQKFLVNHVLKDSEGEFSGLMSSSPVAVKVSSSEAGFSDKKGNPNYKTEEEAIQVQKVVNNNINSELFAVLNNRNAKDINGSKIPSKPHKPEYDQEGVKAMATSTFKNSAELISKSPTVVKISSAEVDADKKGNPNHKIDEDTTQAQKVVNNNINSELFSVLNNRHAKEINSPKILSSPNKPESDQKEIKSMAKNVLNIPEEPNSTKFSPGKIGFSDKRGIPNYKTEEQAIQIQNSVNNNINSELFAVLNSRQTKDDITPKIPPRPYKQESDQEIKIVAKSALKDSLEKSTIPPWKLELEKRKLEAQNKLD